MFIVYLNGESTYDNEILTPPDGTFVFKNQKQIKKAVKRWFKTRVESTEVYDGELLAIIDIVDVDSRKTIHKRIYASCQPTFEIV